MNEPCSAMENMYITTKGGVLQFLNFNLKRLKKSFAKNEYSCFLQKLVNSILNALITVLTFVNIMLTSLVILVLRVKVTQNLLT